MTYDAVLAKAIVTEQGKTPLKDLYKKYIGSNQKTYAIGEVEHAPEDFVRFTEADIEFFKEYMNMDKFTLTFTKAELDGIYDALEYLLGAELLPENGYTDDVVDALESAKDKVGSYLEDKQED